MALLERVSTLIRANLNDLVDKAENPEKVIKQVILDMENQYLQVKTQVAIAIADLHMLQKKKDEYQESMSEWMRKAEKSVVIQQDELARAALERYRNFRQMAQGYAEQVDDQQAQVEGLKNALQKLEQKLVQAKAKKDLLIARHRRSQVAGKANQAQAAIGAGAKAAAFDRMSEKVLRAEAIGEAHKELTGENVDDQFAELEKNEEVERLLAEIKGRKALNP
ncbi:MAG TPA: PspA/IM30 family protein [Candidatus Acidoferrales bacterium]|nr:PspA/IM30 family protein [Candidatus Acidoferrales bacterium]